MNNIKKIFQEVNREILKVIVLNNFLDTVMFFFVFYFLISFINIDIIYAVMIPLFASLIYFIVSFFIKVRKAKIKDLEKANPEISEILRTAHDNIDSDSVMSKALFHEVEEKMRKVSTGGMLDSKKVMTRVMSAIFIVFVTIFLSTVTVDIKKIDIPFDKLNFIIPGQKIQGRRTNRFSI
jgi:hypothetical protein